MSRAQRALIDSLEPRAYLAAQLVADLNPVTFSTLPAALTPVGASAYFVRNTNELWQTDGTVPGSHRVGTFGGTIYSFTALTALPAAGALIFEKDYTVYRTDGTAAGTFPLASLNEHAYPTFTDSARVFWQVNYAHWPTFQPHRELWTSDGTVAGTRKVVDFATDFTAESPAGLAFLSGAFNNGVFYFLARDGANVISLWTTDGTAAGTRRITDVGSTDSYNYNGDAPRLLSSGGKLFVVKPSSRNLNNNRTTYTLYVSDGTAAGTRSFASFSNDAFSNSGLIAVADGRIFYRNDGGSTGGGIELWSSDGTAAGTAMLKDIVPGRSGSYPDDVTAAGNDVYFNIRSSTASPRYDQLWKTDGTPAGTTLVTFPASPDGGAGFVRAGGAVFYKDGDRLKRTDGTPAGTFDTTPPDTTDLGAPVPFGAGVLFTGKHPIHGTELWHTEGAAATARVIDLTPQTQDGVGGDFVELGGKAYFSGAYYRTQAGAGGPGPLGLTGGLMTTDGTPAGTLPVRTGLSIYGPIVRSGGRLFFTAWDFSQNPGRGLWASDGTTAGTVLVKPIPPSGGEVTIARFLTDVDGTLFYAVVDGQNNWRLWRSDGTEAGTTKVSETLSVYPQSATSPLMAVGRTLYFTAADSAAGAGSELYKLDLDGNGVPALVRDINPGPGWSSPVPLAAMNGRLYFSALEAGPYRRLFVTDGTAAGTVPLGDVSMGSSFTQPDTRTPRAAVFNNAVYFAGGGVVLGVSEQYGLWKTDGTSEGTVRVVPTEYGTGDVFAAGGRLYFTAYLNTYPVSLDLYGSDGTAEGTVALRRFNFVGEKFVAHAGREFFAADTPFFGTELWSTDGTPAGTRIEADLSPGAASGTPHYAWAMGAAGGMLLFNGKTPQHGAEPRKWVAGGAPAAAVAGRSVFFNDSQLDGRDPGAGPSDDAAISSTTRALLPGETADQNNRTNYTRGLNGIMVDIANLPGSVLSADDFEFRQGTGGDPANWAPLPTRPDVAVRRGAGPYSTDRVTLIWPDRGAVRNAWLQVTVKANGRTGLAAPDVFYFGNLVGDWYNQGAAIAVDRADFAWTRGALGPAAHPAAPMPDFNRDGRIDVRDLLAVRSNLGRTLAAFTAPPTPAPVAPATPAGVIPVPSRPPASRPRRLLYQVVDVPPA